MARPSKGEIEVATAALRSEARVWDEQGGEMGKIPGMADGLRLDRLPAGVFQIIVSAYGAVVDEVSDRSAEAQLRMAEVGDTLIKVANTYDREEQQNLHKIKNLY